MRSAIRSSLSSARLHRPNRLNFHRQTVLNCRFAIEKIYPSRGIPEAPIAGYFSRKIMRALFSLLLLLCWSQVPAQDSTSPLPDSLTQAMPNSWQINDSQAKKESMDQMSNNLTRFMEIQKEREQKQFRQALIRMGIGLFFLVVLIIGWRRNRRMKKAPPAQ